ncbi:low temperature requirement protein A [Streptomyces sp. ISL-86]|uniref:low temperature requirement protein A n=1 Tax=Streptomyces sp. ISL-86 TaxID=2819187 RepID=UPI001BEA19AF|nr:low temperature requirement protein A [Streptomyces sp. ISL-86]MBT2454453.1 low temperature requirement protein A [Streptomyces sp. ISL-86]
MARGTYTGKIRLHRGRVRLRVSEEGTHRAATPLELFFDLVFVVAVAELVEVLLGSPSWPGALHFTALFVPIWWTWVCFTFYADRFDNDDRVYRLIMIAAMMAVLLLSVAVPHAFDGAGGAKRFALGYFAARLILVGLYLRAHFHVPKARLLTKRFLQGYGLGAALWGASALLPVPYCYVLWVAGLVAELLTPILSSSAIARVPFNVSHVPERFGLFTIIVLGEVVALNAIGIASSRLRAEALVVVAGSFLLAACQWWIVFDHVDASPLRQWRLTGQAYVYGHLFVHGGIAVTGVGGLLAAREADAGGPPLSDGGPVLCFGVAAFLLGVGGIHLLNVGLGGDLRSWSRLGLGAVFVLFGVAGDGISPVLLETLLVGGLACQILIESRAAVVGQVERNPRP